MAITGLFEHPHQASAAVDDLIAAGVPVKAVSVVATDSLGEESFGIREKTKVAEGAAIGAGTGGSIAALVAGFTAVGALGATGIGLLAAGPIVAALAGAGAGAAAGGLIGGAIGLGIPEHEVKFYEDKLEKGAVLVGVDTDRVRNQDVKEIFRRHGADRVATA
jgi:hypothetical protein